MRSVFNFLAIVAAASLSPLGTVCAQEFISEPTGTTAISEPTYGVLDLPELTPGVSTQPAETPSTFPPPQQTSNVSPATQQSPGASTSPELTSGLTGSEEYSDNIYAARTDKVSDWISVLNPFANLRIKGQNGEANIGGNAFLGRYARHPDENYDDYSVYANGRYNLSPMFTLFGGGGYDHLHDPRSSPNAQPGVTPTVYGVTRAFGAALMKFDQGTLRIGGTFDRYDYQNVAKIGGGTINNEDRDRDMATVGARIGHSLNANNELFAMFSYDNRDYRLPVDDYGYRKDSDGVRYSAGWHYHEGDTLDGEIYAGGIYQHYVDPRFSPVAVPDFGGQLRWTGIPATTLTAKLERTIQETDIQGSSGYLDTSASFNVVHWIRPNLRVQGGASYDLDRFNAINRVDQVQTFGLGVRDYVSPNFFIGADFSQAKRDSTDLDESYIEYRAMVRAAFIQKPAYTEADFKGPEVPRESRGRFYVGAQTGISNVETKLQGSRETNGTLNADFGDEGWSNDLFAGYGLYIGDWYLALEAEASKATGGWSHAHVPNERVFSVSRDYEFGLSGIIGRSFKGGTMLYGKAGVIGADFDTNYQLRQNGTHDERTEPGLRVGIGGSAPITSDLAVRLEHTFAAFDSYNISCCIDPPPPRGTPDNFTNDEAITSLGLVYTFDGVPTATTSADVDYRGLYAGGQVGQDALSTWMTGPRSSGTRLTADFGDVGYTAGVFGGYGFQFDKFYLGGELEAELGKTHSDHEREGGGQSFSVEKQWTYGASLRAGYVVNNTALLYARVGVAQSLFQVDYAREGEGGGGGGGCGDDCGGEEVVAAAENQKGVTARYNETGLRIGGGMELPVSDDLTARLDYTHTFYPAFSLLTPPNGDLQRFRPSEDLFRISILHKFGS